MLLTGGLILQQYRGSHLKSKASSDCLSMVSVDSALSTDLPADAANTGRVGMSSHCLLDSHMGPPCLFEMGQSQALAFCVLVKVKINRNPSF